MFHNTLYRLERGQKVCLTALGLLFLVASAIWLFAELVEWWFPMEPVVVLLGGLATLLASFWPWKPGYAARRMKGRVVVDYMSNDHYFLIGQGDREFTLQFSKASGDQIRLYGDPPNIERIALASDAGRISDIKDATALDFSNRVASPSEGEIVVLQNVHGNYAAIHVHDVRDLDRDDDRDELTFSYVINPDGGSNFS